MQLPEMKVVSFNIWDLPLWFVNDRRGRIEKIAEYLKSTNADIICLQESFDVGHRALLQKKLAGYHMTAQARPRFVLPYASLDTTGGLVIFSKYPIVSQNFALFSRFNYSVIEYFSRKGVLQAVLDTPFGQIKVLNTHLHKERKFLGKAMRLRQLAIILNLIKDEATMPTIFAGDFNEHALMEQPEYRQLLHSKNFIHPIQENPLAPSYRLDNILVGDSWINRVASSRRLDYILIKSMEAMGLRAINYAPVYLDPVLSDHDPILMHLSAE